MELTLNIDEYGRTAPQDTDKYRNPLLNYETKAILFENFDAQFCERIIEDCKEATSSELPLTFWMSIGDKPRILLEKLAMDIFYYHVKSTCELNPKTSGCEWWVQLRPSPNKNRINSTSPEAQRGIEFHWDKDETLRDVSGGLFIHPHLSTVTYLTDFGAPTMIFDESTPDDSLIERDINSAFISWPRRGKHLSFDGRYLHGAPSSLLQLNHDEKLPPSENNIRVTFLVNIWLHHKPLGIERFPEAVRKIRLIDESCRTEMMVSPPLTTPNKPLSSPRHVVVDNNTDTIDFTWGLGECVSIHTNLPINIISRCKNNINDDDSKNDRNVLVTFVTKAMATRVRGKKMNQ